MDPLSILMAIGQFVPSVLRWVGSDKAADVADKAVAVARSVTGAESQDTAIAALRAQPELLLQYQQAMNTVVLAELEADCRALESVNATMRAESQSQDPYVRRARPTFLYAMALTWTVQTMGLILAVLLRPELAPPLLAAAGDLTTMWGVALTVVGVAVKSRSDDKARAMGLDVPSLAQSASRIFKKG